MRPTTEWRLAKTASQTPKGGAGRGRHMLLCFKATALFIIAVNNDSIKHYIRKVVTSDNIIGYNI